jgi:hypothetical protein
MGKAQRNPEQTLVRALTAAIGAVIGLVGAAFLAAGFNFGYPVHWGWLVLGVIFASATVLSFSLVTFGIQKHWLVAVGLALGWVAISLGAIAIDVHLHTHSVAEATASERPLLNRIAPFLGATPLGYETDPRGGDSDWGEGFLNQPDWYMLTRSERLPRTATAKTAVAHYVKAFERAGYRHPSVEWSRPRKGVPPDRAAGELPFVYISTDLDTLQPLSVDISRVDGRLVASVAADTEGSG